MRPAHALIVIILVERERSCAVALIICLVDDVEAHRVAELVEPWRIGIVAGAHSVEVAGLDHPQVLHGLVYSDDRAGDRVGLMPVDSSEGDRGAVQSKNEIPDLYAPEADLFGDDFTAGVHDQCVERRTFSAPKRRIINVD